MAYFDLEYLKNMGSVPSAELDSFDAANPGRITALIESVCRLMDSVLFKRYATPFANPPEVVKFRGTQILSHQLRVIIGFDPGSTQDQQIIDARKEAFDWLSDAVDSKDGCVELPLREPDAGKADVTGVSRKKARAFSYDRAIDWHRERKCR